MLHTVNLLNSTLVLALVAPSSEPTTEAEGAERRLELRSAAQFQGEGDAVFGTSRAGEGFVQFESRVVGDHIVEIQLQTSTLAATFVPDFETGRLRMQTNDGLLVAADWKAIRQADEALRSERGEAFNPLAALYLSRSLSMLADSEPGFVWETRDVPLPTMADEDPSFYNAEAYRDPAGESVARLSRGEHFEPAAFADEAVVLSRPPSLDEGPSGPSSGGSTSSGGSSGPKCTAYFTDKADGNITCDEYGNYYCVQYDYYPGPIIRGQKTMKAIAPAIPPTWSRTTASKTTVYGQKELNGAYPCSGRCGPGCEDGPWVSGGKAGGWGMGCLIHDQCVYQSTGGETLDKLWEQPNNIQASPDCGAEMMAAADDYFMPPEFCPGSDTVGGSGKWTRNAPPSPKFGWKRDNTVSSTRAKSVGKVKKPN